MCGGRDSQRAVGKSGGEVAGGFEFSSRARPGGDGIEWWRKVIKDRPHPERQALLGHGLEDESHFNVDRPLYDKTAYLVLYTPNRSYPVIPPHLIWTHHPRCPDVVRPRAAL